MRPAIFSTADITFCMSNSLSSDVYRRVIVDVAARESHLFRHINSKLMCVANEKNLQAAPLVVQLIFPNLGHKFVPVVIFRMRLQPSLICSAAKRA